MKSGILWIIVDWFSLPVLLILASILAQRRYYREFPLFFSYIVVSSVAAVSRLYAYLGSSGTAYFYTYWVSEVAITLCALLATYELFVKRIFPRFYAVRFYRYLFPAVAILTAAGATLTAIESTKISFRFIRMTHAFDFFRVAVLLFFIALMLFIGRRWSRYEFGIAAGFAIDAAAFLATFAVWTHNAPVRRSLDELPVLAYDVACVIWLITFLRRQETTSPPLVVTSDFVRQAKAMQATLKDSVTGRKPDAER